MKTSEFTKTLNCTECGKTLHYSTGPSFYTCRNRRDRQGFILCKECKDIRASQVNKSNPKITGRPKGSKNGPGITAWNKGVPGAGKRLSDSLTFEQRMKGIAKRNGYETYEEYRDSLPAWRRYKVDVWRVTKNQPLHLLENYEKRGVNGEQGAYTLDHIVSLKKGFKQGIPPEEIGDLSNLTMLPWEENITKGWK